jgi:CubicO group peptidase (beta-lactamase class C family)
MLLVLAACGGGGGGGGGDPPAPPATNAPPTVNAGADATVTLPDAKVSLAGQATDDGPAASLTHKWTATGPAAVAFVNDAAPATDATFSAAGSYTLTLTVNDGTQNGTDSLVVTVSGGPATGENWPADDVNETDTFHGWAKVEPADVGMTLQGLEDAAAFAQNVPAGARSDPGNGMIVRNGQLVHFWGNIDERKEVKSVTKSMGGIVLGIAIDEAKVALSGKAVDYIPTFGTPPAENASKGTNTITLAQLATHTAGFEKDGGFAAIIAQGPGTTWKYSDAGLNWLADVLTTVYQEDLKAFSDRRVWQVLGLNKVGTTGDDVFWRTSIKRPPTRDGGTLQYRELASGLDANVNAMARVGLLFLRKGVWNGTRVVSEDFITRVQTPLPENNGLNQDDPTGYPGARTDYGVLWWTNKSGLMQNVPTDTYWAWGLGEALIVVIPSLDLVIARNGGQSDPPAAPNGRVWNDDFWDGNVAVLENFLDPIVAATTP